MSDNYQAVYDAVRSRMSGCDVGQVVAEVARQCWDMSFMIPVLQQEIILQHAEHARPCAVFRPALTMDGNQWCALYGANLHDGIAGFGDTPDAAMRAFDQAWISEKSHD